MRLGRYCITNMLLFVAILSTCGCVTAMGNKAIADEQIVASIQRGITTKSEVQEKLGIPSTPPQIVNDEEWWYYLYTRTTERITNYIPIIDIFFGGRDTESHSLQIKFGLDGIVRDVSKGALKGGGGGIQDMNK